MPASGAASLGAQMRQVRRCRVGERARGQGRAAGAQGQHRLSEAGAQNARTALGQAGVGFNGLFLSTGSAINWANGDVTITHGSTNFVTVAGGDFVMGAGLSTAAVDGLPYIPTSTSASTSAPTGRTGTGPMVYNTAQNRLWIYNGAWRSVLLASSAVRRAVWSRS
jgi:hypothetical protein